MEKTFCIKKAGRESKREREKEKKGKRKEKEKGYMGNIDD
jgi:hypothetical protein